VKRYDFWSGDRERVGDQPECQEENTANSSPFASDALWKTFTSPSGRISSNNEEARKTLDVRVPGLASHATKDTPVDLMDHNLPLRTFSLEFGVLPQEMNFIVLSQQGSEFVTALDVYLRKNRLRLAEMFRLASAPATIPPRRAATGARTKVAASCAFLPVDFAQKAVCTAGAALSCEEVLEVFAEITRIAEKHMTESSSPPDDAFIGRRELQFFLQKFRKGKIIMRKVSPRQVRVLS